MRQTRYILTATVATVLLTSWTIAIDTPHRAKATPLSDRAKAESTYFLTLTLPAQTRQPFTTLSFTELDQNPAIAIPFDFDRTEAFLGTPAAIGRSIAINGAWIDETGTVWVEFDRAVAAGTTLTIAFKAQTRSSNLQTYGIAAYSENAAPVFVGNERLTVRP